MSVPRCNEILIRYETLNDFDLKIRVTKNLVIAFLLQVYRYTSKEARKMIAQSERNKTFPDDYTDDERFYRYCKCHFYYKARQTVAEGRYLVLYEEKSEDRKKEFYSFITAKDFFDKKAVNGYPVAMFKESSAGEYRLTPAHRRNDATELIIRFVSAERRRRGLASEVAECRRNRFVSDCKECIRYEICEERKKENEI